MVYMKRLTILILVFMTFSCKNYFNYVSGMNEYVTELKFCEGENVVYENGYKVIYIDVEPVDSIYEYENKFTIVNSDIAQIIEVGQGYCIVEGINVGQTILVCTIENKEAKTVITVKENEL